MVWFQHTGWLAHPITQRYLRPLASWLSVILLTWLTHHFLQFFIQLFLKTLLLALFILYLSPSFREWVYSHLPWWGVLRYCLGKVSTLPLNPVVTRRSVEGEVADLPSKEISTQDSIDSKDGKNSKDDPEILFFNDPVKKICGYSTGSLRKCTNTGLCKAHYKLKLLEAARTVKKN